MSATTLTITSGILTSTADITVSGLTTIQGGAITGSGDVNANDGILLDPAGATFFLDGRTMINALGQTATWSGNGSSVEMEDGAVFNNLGTFLAETTGLVEQGAGAASSFNNQGTFTRSTSTGSVNFDSGVSFNSAGGSVDVQTGTLGLLGGGTDTSATYTVESGATLDLAGSQHHRLCQQHLGRRHRGFHRRQQRYDRHRRDLQRHRRDDR